MKKLFLLPVLLLALTACGGTSSTESSVEPSSSSEEPSSSQFVADERVWRAVGDFGTSGWDAANDTYLMTRVSEGVNRFEITIDDFYTGKEFQVVHDGGWDGQLGFSSVTSMTPEGCFIEGGGYATKNIQAAQDGKYHIVLDTTNTFVPTIQITRVSDPTNPPIVETDSGAWYLTGSMNNWTITDTTTYALAAVADTTATYESTFTFDAGTNFQLNTEGTWDRQHGAGYVDVSGGTPTGVDLGAAGQKDNISITEAGQYTVRFVWAAGAGSITITQVAAITLTTIEAVMTLAASPVSGAMSALHGQTVTVKGVITGILEDATVYLQDGEHGIILYGTGLSTQPWTAIGNVVFVTGAVTCFRFTIEIGASATPPTGVVVGIGGSITPRVVNEAGWNALTPSNSGEMVTMTLTYKSGAPVAGSNKTILFSVDDGDGVPTEVAVYFKSSINTMDATVCAALVAAFPTVVGTVVTITAPITFYASSTAVYNPAAAYTGAQLGIVVQSTVVTVSTPA